METIPKLNDDEFLCTLTHRCLALVLLYQSIVLKRMKTPEFGTLKSYSELLVHSNSNSRTLRRPSCNVVLVQTRVRKIHFTKKVYNVDHVHM